jgi:hypothetical protein
LDRQRKMTHAQTDRAAHRHQGRRQPAQTHRGVCRTGDLRSSDRQRRPHGVAARVSGAGPSYRNSKRSPSFFAGRCGSSTRAAVWMLRPGRPWSPHPASGSATAPPQGRRSTSPSACRRSRSTASIAMNSDEVVHDGLHRYSEGGISGAEPRINTEPVRLEVDAPSAARRPDRRPGDGDARIPSAKASPLTSARVCGQGAVTVALQGYFQAD